MANYRPPQTAANRRYLLAFIVLPVILAIALTAMVLGGRFGGTSTLDGDLCRTTGDIDSHAVFLMDLRKPLGDTHRSLPGSLLRDVTFDLEAGTELRVLDLTGDLAMPTRLVGRLCKPFDNSELTVPGGVGQLAVAHDCGDLPVGLDDVVRDRATRFCALRQDLRQRIDDIARRPDAPVTNAYLMEAIEDASLTLADRPGQRALYVFSDMMQHAAWYSHLELGEEGWSFEDFTDLRLRESTLVGAAGTAPEVRVHVLYAPRESLTEEPSAELAHKQFWHGFFAGHDLTFRDLPVLPAYEAAPLIGNLPEAERLERQRRDYQRRRLRAETTLRELQEELAELQDQRDQMPADRARQSREIESREPSPERSADRDAAEPRDRTPPPVADAGTPLSQPAEQPPAEPRAELGQPARPPPAEPATELEQPAEQPPAEPATELERPAQPPPAEPATELERPAEQPPAEPATELEQPAEQPPAESGRPAQPPPAETSNPSASVEPQPLPPDPAAEPTNVLADSPPTLAAEQPPCATRAKHTTGDIYPGRHRMNYGAAEIVVRYVVDEQGRTEDDGILIVDEGSSATRPRYFDLFAEKVRTEVKDWEFDFVDVDGGCRKRQEITTKLVFQFSRSFRR